jgi:hypothetical protein
MAKAKTILIGSKLPTGLILHHPLDPTIKVTIRGLNGAARGTNGQPISVPYVLTEVDEEFWEAWKAAHDTPRTTFPPLKSGGLFEAKDEASAKSIAREFEKHKTGLEPLNHAEGGVKPADKE